jgi:hypothetical protein
MWWWDKNHPLALYLDRRAEPPGSIPIRPNWSVQPDFIADFRALPFRNESFQMVVFDPPHIVRENESRSFLRLKYGELHPDTADDDLRRGFAECWRVLARGGSLIFKWGVPGYADCGDALATWWADAVVRVLQAARPRGGHR